MTHRALIDAAAAGQRANCSNVETHAYWTSEHDGERAQAALWCYGCIVYTECGDAAEARQERFGVWASVDRTRHANGKAPAASPNCDNSTAS